MKFYSNLAIIIRVHAASSFTGRCASWLKSTWRTSYYTGSYFPISNIINEIQAFFWLHCRQEVESSLVIVLTHHYSVTSITNINELVTQLFLAWPQLFGIMMSTWQVWGPLLLLQVPFSAFLYKLLITSNGQITLSCYQYRGLNSNYHYSSIGLSNMPPLLEKASISDKWGPRHSKLASRQVHQWDGDEHHHRAAAHHHWLDDRCFLQLRHWEVHLMIVPDLNFV